MSSPMPVRRASTDLFPVFPVTVIIFAIAVLGCSAMDGALRSTNTLIAMVSMVLLVLVAMGFATMFTRA